MIMQSPDRSIGICEWTSGDINAMHRWFACRHVTRYLSWGGSIIEDSHRHLDECIRAQSESPRTKFYFAVCDTDTNRIIGDAGFHWIKDCEQKTGEIGYFLEHEYWGRGIGTIAATLVLKYAFEIESADVMRASCDSRNVASERVMQKCGLEPIEGPGPGTRKIYQIDRARWSG